jgi:hypothetical protein
MRKRIRRRRKRAPKRWSFAALGLDVVLRCTVSRRLQGAHTRGGQSYHRRYASVSCVAALTIPRLLQGNIDQNMSLSIRYRIGWCFQSIASNDISAIKH